MVILNFTVPFALKAIPKGLKKRTMRPVRENPNSNWNRLYNKWNQTSINVQDYLDKIDNPQLHHKKIELQLWWQQRSSYWICSECKKKRKMSHEERDLYVETFQHVLTPELMKPIACKHCNGLTYEKEAHKLADAVLTNMTKRTLGSLTEDEWKADGFTCMADGFVWFMNTYKITREIAEILEVYIIEWELV
jgi:hypothetical protein